MRAAYEMIVPCEGNPPSITGWIAEATRLLTCEHSKFRVVQQESGSVLLRVGWSPESWGEWVTIAAGPSSIRITSACSFPIQILDWGKNRKNIELVRSTLLRVGRIDVRQPAPIRRVRWSDSDRPEPP